MWDRSIANNTIVTGMTRIVPIMLAGGKGERFWPMSRIARPKQFLRLDGTDRSLLQATADRLLPLANWDSMFVITGAHTSEGVKSQLPSIPERNILLEPQGRDTASAVALATLEISKRFGGDAVCGFFPVDHTTDDISLYCDTLAAGVELADSQKAIVTLGITPLYPSTAHGYIEKGAFAGHYSAGCVKDAPAYKVCRFTEKPDEATAERFIDSGNYYWNSGMFLSPAGTMLTEFKKHAPEIIDPLTSQGIDAYSHLPKISIDYAVMEKTDHAYILPVEFSWPDLGNWNAIEKFWKNDSDNVELCNHLGLDTKESILYSTDSEELIVTIGLDNVVIVRDGNATLIVKKDRTNDIKKVVKMINADDSLRRFL